MYEPAPYVKLREKATRESCFALVMTASERWKIPPAHITSHVRANNAPEARRWVMREMIDTLGLKRCQVAWAFGVDLRRVRASEIGGKRTPHGRPGGDRFRRVDLLGFPLESPAPKKPPTVSYRERFREAMRILELAARESEVAHKFVRMFEG